MSTADDPSEHRCRRCAYLDDVVTWASVVAFVVMFALLVCSFLGLL